MDTRATHLPDHPVADALGRPDDHPAHHPSSRPAWLLVAAGVAFAAYPALRPYGPETGVAGAHDLASPAWPFAHLLGIAGFACLAFALRLAAHHPTWWPTPGPSRAPRRVPQWTPQWAHRTEAWAWLAVVLLLPYYGAEAYGLHAVAQYALDQSAPDVLAIADAFRYAPLPLTLFGLGFVALAVTGGRLAHGLWAAGGTLRTGGVLAAAALVTYLPQFFLPPAGRIAHGLALGAGLLLVALGSLRPSSR
jgi:hypothetical protein